MLAGAGLALACLVMAAPAGAVSTRQIISRINAERTANGIPGGVSENPTWTQDCRLHIQYMIDNHYFGHVESPGRPGYTSGGAFAGLNSVISVGSSWASGDPFDDAPFHLMQLMNPALTQVGAVQYRAYSCVTTFPGFSPSFTVAQDTLWSWPGNGTSGLHWAWTFNELPHAPGDDVGLSQHSITGPDIIVIHRGPAALGPLDLLQSATLTGPSGPVEVRIVNDRMDPLTTDESGFVIAVHPLAPGATYTVSPTFTTGAGGAQVRSWTGSFSFTTEAKPATRRLLSFGQIRRRGRYLVLPLRVTGWPLTAAHLLGWLTASIGRRHHGARYPIHIGTGMIRLPGVLRRQHDTIRVIVPRFSYGGVRFKSTVIAKRL